MKNDKLKKAGFATHFGRAIDSCIGIFAPKRAFMNEKYRTARSMLTAYRGAETGYLRENWVGSSGSADQDLLPELSKLRKRSRDLVRNEPFAAGAIEATWTNTIGTGLRPQSSLYQEELGISPEQAKVFQRKAERIWERWSLEADAGERNSIYDLQRLIDVQILESGESFVITNMITEPYRNYSLALDVVEADRIDTPWGDSVDKNVRQGVKLGERGQPVGYYVRKTHPGDYLYSRGYGLGDYRYIPARNDLGRKNILHLYVQKRAGQSRGVPFFAPVLNYFKDLGDYLEGELIAQRMAACIGLVVKSEEDSGTVAGKQSEESDSDSRLIAELYPGMTKYLQPGESIETINPLRPGAQFDPFVNRVLKMICSALNLNYETVSKDFSETNYSSARAALLEARKYFKYRQLFMATYLCQPVYEMLLEEAYLRGELEASSFYEQKADWCRVRWIAPGWDYIDPLKEAAAAEKSIQTGVSCLANEVAAKGQDWEDVMNQRARELAKKKELEEKYKIKFDADKPGQTGPTDPGTKPGEEQTPEDGDEAEEPVGKRKSGGDNE